MSSKLSRMNLYVRKVGIHFTDSSIGARLTSEPMELLPNKVLKLCLAFATAHLSPNNA